MHFDLKFCIFAEVIYSIIIFTMRQQELVKLYFSRNEDTSSWEFCFNDGCPLAKECIHQLSVPFIEHDVTHGRAIFPHAYRKGSCQHFLQFRLTKIAWGFTHILSELRKKDEVNFRSSMISYFGSSTSFYRYKLGQVPISTCQQQYVLDYLKNMGYDNLAFDRYTEELEYLDLRSSQKKT